MNSFKLKRLSLCILLSLGVNAQAATNVYRVVIPNLQVNASDSAASSPDGTSTPPAVQAGLLATPTALQFGTLDFGQTAQKTLTLTNPGDASLSLGTAGLSGAGFSVVHNDCASTLAGKASCSYTIAFTPIDVGVVDGQFSLSGNGGAAAVVVPLRAGGNSGTLQFNPATLDFSDQLLDSTQTVPVRLTNTSSTNPVQVTGIDADPLTHFNTSNNCGQALAAGAHCDINVLFKPSALGTLAAQLYVTSNAANATPVGTTGVRASAMSLVGHGVGSIATLTTSPALELGSGTPGGAPLSGKWTFRNDGNVAMTLVAPQVPAPFTLTNACVAVVPGATCDMTVASATSELGTFAASNLAVTGATRGSRDDLSVRAAISGAVVSLKTASTVSLTAAKGGAAASTVVTFENSGNQPVTLTLAGLASPYSVDKTTCTVPARSGVTNGECSVTVSMATGGTRGAQPSQTLVATGSSGTLSVAVTGLLEEAYGALVAATNLAFGDVPVGSSVERTVSFHNEGNAPAKNTYLLIWGANYQLQLKAGSSCGTQAAPVWVQPGESCTATLVYTPDTRAALDAAAELRMNTSAQGGPFTLPVSGRGVAAVPTLTAQTNAAFGTRIVGTTDTRSFTFRNDGNIALTNIAASVAGAGLSLSANSCGTGSGTLAPQASCTLSVAWTPTQAGALSNAQVVVNSSAGASSVDLSGTAVQTKALTASGPLTFGSVAVQQASAAKTFVLSNPADNPAIPMVSVQSNDAALALSHDCGSTLQPGASCTVTGVYTATTVGAKSPTVTVTYDTGKTLTVGASATAYAGLTKTGNVALYTDGNMASSCNAYRNPQGYYQYSGTTGNGWYRIWTQGASLDVYCDMTSDGGGWTRVVQQYEAAPVKSWAGGTTTGGTPAVTSYVVAAARVPAHTQVAFGQGDTATAIDYVNWTYTAGNIGNGATSGNRGVRVTGNRTGKSFDIYRNTSNFPGYQNPEEAYWDDAPHWFDCLTFDETGGQKYTWAFCPNATNSNGAGYNYGGAKLDGSAQSYSWSVWVR